MASIPKKFAVISDVHARSNRPGDHIDKYLAAINWCIKNRHVLYHAGDIVEGYDKKTNLETIDYYIRADIIDSMMNGTFIVGNHDNEFFGETNGTVDFIHDRRRKIMLTHGQRFDMCFADPEMEAGNDFWSKLAYRMDLMNARMISTFSRGVRNVGFTKRAFDYMESEDIRLLICGHTHRPEIVKQGDRTLAVSGAWGETAKDEQRKLVLVDGYDVQLIGLEEM